VLGVLRISFDKFGFHPILDGIAIYTAMEPIEIREKKS